MAEKSDLAGKKGATQQTSAAADAKNNTAAWLWVSFFGALVLMGGLWMAMRDIQETGPGAYADTWLGRLLGQDSAFKSAETLLADGHFILAQAYANKIVSFEAVEDPEVRELKGDVHLAITVRKLLDAGNAEDAREALSRVSAKRRNVAGIKALREEIDQLFEREAERLKILAEKEAAIVKRMAAQAEEAEKERRERDANLKEAIKNILGEGDGALPTTNPTPSPAPTAAAPAGEAPANAPAQPEKAPADPANPS